MEELIELFEQLIRLGNAKSKAKISSKIQILTFRVDENYIPDEDDYDEYDDGEDDDGEDNLYLMNKTRFEIANEYKGKFELNNWNVLIEHVIENNDYILLNLKK